MSASSGRARSILPYAYDANSQRYSKTTGSKTTVSVWSNGGIFYDDILSSSGTTQSSSQYLPGNMGVVKDGVLYSNAVDGKGDVAATLTNNTGDITDYNFDAYGNKTTSGALASPYGYRGYYQDSETGFYYLNARYYDPGTRQFTQEDTYAGNINSPETLNRYSYCAGNPVMYSDPSGHRIAMNVDDPDEGPTDAEIEAFMGGNYHVNHDDPFWVPDDTSTDLSASDKTISTAVNNGLSLSESNDKSIYHDETLIKDVIIDAILSVTVYTNRDAAFSVSKDSCSFNNFFGVAVECFMNGGKVELGDGSKYKLDFGVQFSTWYTTFIIGLTCEPTGKDYDISLDLHISISNIELGILTGASIAAAILSGGASVPVEIDAVQDIVVIVAPQAIVLLNDFVNKQ